MKSLLPLPLLLLPLLTCCTQSVTEEVDSITSSLSVQTGSLEIQCGLSGVCSESLNFRRYAYEVDNLYVGLLYDPAVIDDKSEESFNENLNAMSFALSFPQLDSDQGGRRKRHTASLGYVDLEEVPLTYDGTSLEFTLRGSFDALHVDIEDAGDFYCNSGDVLGQCFELIHLDAPIDYEIAFTLEVPQD